MNFDIYEFDNIVKSIISSSETIDDVIDQISLDIDNLIQYLKNNNETILYNKWCNMKRQVDLTKAKYKQKEKNIINDLTSYKQQILSNDEQIYKDTKKIVNDIINISEQIDKF